MSIKLIFIHLIQTKLSLMRSPKLLLVITLTVLFASCSKEKSVKDPSNPNPTTISKLKTYTEDLTASGTHSVVTYDLAYDNSSRLVSMISEASAGDKFLFKYNTNNFTGDIYAANKLSIHEIFFMNTNSFVDSTFQYNDTQDTSTEKYIYNSAKQIITLKEYDYSTAGGSQLSNITYYTYDSNGNQVSATDDFSVTTYDYTTLLNNLVLGPFYIPMNKNLVKTTSVASGGQTDVLHHAYTFDSSGRLSTEKITTDTGEVVIKTYTY
jgi:hypothetical protein